MLESRCYLLFILKTIFWSSIFLKRLLRSYCSQDKVEDLFLVSMFSFRLVGPAKLIEGLSLFILSFKHTIHWLCLYEVKNSSAFASNCQFSSVLVLFPCVRLTTQWVAANKRVPAALSPSGTHDFSSVHRTQSSLYFTPFTSVWHSSLFCPTPITFLLTSNVHAALS